MIFSKGDKILFIGDSISDYDRKKPVGEGLFDGWGHSFISDVGALLGCVCPDEHLRVVNMGISGNTIRDLDKRWQTDVFDLHPDWVCMLIGINDVWRHFDSPEIKEDQVPLDEFRSTYERLIECTLPEVKGMVLMTPYYMTPEKTDAMRASMDEYGSVVKELGEKYNIITIDLQEGWDKLFQHMHPCNIAWDRVHPNQIGCMYIARQFLQAVGFQW